MKFLISLFLFGATLMIAGMTAGWVYAAPEIVRAAESDKNSITLTARNVTSAVDIEMAATTASARGTRPGTVILDGRDGPFVYSADDRSVNIFYSNLTFRGVNNAYFTNTDDGFFFDDLPADNIRIEGLFMVSKGGGVVGVGSHKNVVVRGCTFRASSTAVVADRGKNWTVTENIFLAGDMGVQFIQGSVITVSHNTISAPRAVVLDGSFNAKILNNDLNATSQGIVLTSEASGIDVLNNTILGVQSSGISLQPGVTNNRVSQNKVLCALGVACQTVEASPNVMEMNRISGNLP